MSSPPPASPPMVWPPSNPSGTVIPFPLPWGQAGCCPPGGMDALMKCYCDIQQASAFIGQIMLDQINNNPAIIAAIIAGIENSGSSLPTLGVTNGTPAQPGQVGEFIQFGAASTDPGLSFPVGTTTLSLSLGVLQPGDWDCELATQSSGAMTSLLADLNPVPAGFSGRGTNYFAAATPPGAGDTIYTVGPITQALTSVPSLIVAEVTVVTAAAVTVYPIFTARRAR